MPSIACECMCACECALCSTPCALYPFQLTKRTKSHSRLRLRPLMPNTPLPHPPSVTNSWFGVQKHDVIYRQEHLKRDEEKAQQEAQPLLRKALELEEVKKDDWALSCLLRKKFRVCALSGAAMQCNCHTTHLVFHHSHHHPGDDVLGALLDWLLLAGRTKSTQGAQTRGLCPRLGPGPVACL